MSPNARVYPFWFHTIISSHAARLGWLMLVLLGTGSVPWAQASDPQSGDANKSWTTTTESRSDNLNPTRTVEHHTQSGNRTVHTQSIQRRGADGRFEPYQEIEKETVQVDAATVRTTTRTFGQDLNGTRTLVQVTEEEKHSLPGGGSDVVRATSNPDADGKLQLIQRDIEETRKTSENVEETKRTVLLPSVNGGLAPVMKMQERRTRGANDTVDSQTTTLLPDGSGSWQVGEIRKATQRGGKNPSTEERVSRPDAEGNMSEISRTVTNQVETSSGEKRNTVETYSVDVPGTTRDGGLHLVQRATTVQRTSSAGQQTTQEQVEQTNPGDPGAGLRVTVISTNTVRPGPSEAQGTQTIQVRDANGSFGTVWVDISKSNNVHAIEVPIAPSEKAKP